MRRSFSYFPVGGSKSQVFFSSMKSQSPPSRCCCQCNLDVWEWGGQGKWLASLLLCSFSKVDIGSLLGSSGALTLGGITEYALRAGKKAIL